MAEYSRFSAPGLTALGARILEAAGGEKAEALEIATNLVDANLTGHDSHGILRIPRYLEWVKRGYLKFGQGVTVLNENAVIVSLDGNHGFGQVTGRLSVEYGLEKVRQSGLALVALRHGGHLGRIGAWAEMAVNAGYVSIHFVNVANSKIVAPYAGRERRISTAPVTIGIPNGDDDHFILDFSTARGAEGKVMVAFKSGTPVPDGLLIDAEGHPTADPHALYGKVGAGESPNPLGGTGALVAMGDHKGSGLALACELLAGAVTGSGTIGGKHPWNGMLSIYIDPTTVDPTQSFGELVTEYIEYVRSTLPRTPEGQVMIPGEPERRNRQERLANGIPLTADGWESLTEAAASVGIERDEVLRLAGVD